MRWSWWRRRAKPDLEMERRIGLMAAWARAEEQRPAQLPLGPVAKRPRSCAGLGRSAAEDRWLEENMDPTAIGSRWRA